MTTATEPLDTRILPHSLDAEKALLGGILADGSLFLEAAEIVQARDFYRHGHQVLFEAIGRLVAADAGVDILTVKDALVKAGTLDAGGGAVYLATLVDGVPRRSNVKSYARIVREHADRRRLIQAATAVIASAYDTDEDTATLVDHAQQTMFNIAQGESSGGFTKLSDIMPGVLEQIEAWHQNKQGVSGVATGFKQLDEMTRGLQPGNLVIIAARPSMGKSSLALNIAQYVARGDKTVAIFSLEMSEAELAIRTLTSEAWLDSHRLQSGYIRESEWSRISNAIGSLSQLNLYIDESPFITAIEMRARARRLKAEQGLSLLIVDYTQLMIGQERRENRALEVGAISRSLKALAKDLKIPVIALSQLSRKVEERTDKRPMLSDLRESGALEQDADVVIFIYREAVYHETAENERRAELIIGKQRNGPLGTVVVGWMPEQTRFVNLTDLAEPEDQRLPMGDR
jgi:replicative DNA helicase